MSSKIPLAEGRRIAEQAVSDARDKTARDRAEEARQFESQSTANELSDWCKSPTPEPRWPWYDKSAVLVSRAKLNDIGEELQRLTEELKRRDKSLRNSIERHEQIQEKTSHIEILVLRNVQRYFQTIHDELNPKP